MTQVKLLLHRVFFPYRIAHYFSRYSALRIMRNVLRRDDTQLPEIKGFTKVVTALYSVRSLQDLIFLLIEKDKAYHILFVKRSLCCRVCPL